MRFTIDGREFDPDRVDQTVRAAPIEEWTITNTSPMDHPLHLHVWPMQGSSSKAGDPSTCRPGRTSSTFRRAASNVVRIAFDDFTGRTVYHCHILDHEDRGMMGVIEAR